MLGLGGISANLMSSHLFEQGDTYSDFGSQRPGYETQALPKILFRQKLLCS